MLRDNQPDEGSKTWNGDGFRKFCELIPAPIWTADADGTLDYASSLLYQYVGTSPDVLKPDQWLSVIHPEDRERAKGAWRAAVTEKMPYSIEYRLKHRDGPFRWNMTNGVPVLDGNGRVVKWYGTVIDIHDQRITQKALRESEARFRELIAAIDGIVWEADADTFQFTYVSEQAERILGYPAEQWIAQTNFWEANLHPSDADEAVAKCAQATQAGRPHRFQYRMIAADGRIVWIEDSATVVSKDGRKLLRGIMMDITARKLAKLHLAERVKELHCLYEISKLSMDSSKPLADALTAIATLLPSGFLHQHAAVARITLDGREYLSPAWREPVASMQAPLARAENECGFIEVGYPEVPDEPWTGAGTFLAEERQLLDLAALHTGKLLDSHDMREHLAQTDRLRSLGELTGGVAHDFNNLLLVILGNAEMLQSENREGTSGHQAATLIRNAAGRAAELTQKLLSFGRRQSLLPTALDISSLFDEMLRLLRRTLNENIALEVAPPTKPISIVADRSQLENALVNLAVNARDAMRDGGRLRFEADCHVVDEAEGAVLQLAPGTYGVLRVIDTGVGMTPQVLARAFEPFFTTKQVGEGSGLGLSMVYGFARQSGGHVRLDSKNGQGTTVSIFLPLAEARIPPAVVPLVPEVEIESNDVMVLVVEDDDMVRAHVVRQLCAIGFRVVEAGDGPSALVRLADHAEIDLLFTDMAMPGGINGLELIQKAQRMRPSLRAVLTSGYPGEVQASDHSAHSPVQLLRKPYARAELKRALHEALARPAQAVSC